MRFYCVIFQLLLIPVNLIFSHHNLTKQPKIDFIQNPLSWATPGLRHQIVPPIFYRPGGTKTPIDNLNLVASRNVLSPHRVPFRRHKPKGIP